MSTQKNIKINLLLGVFYAAGVLVQLLVITKVIPYNWVNGGMTKSYKSQAAQSVVSILVIVGLYLYCRKLFVSKTALKKGHFRSIYVITFLWCAGFIMQLLGTTFERYIMSVVLLFGVAAHIMLIQNLKTSKG